MKGDAGVITTNTHDLSGRWWMVVGRTTFSQMNCLFFIWVVLVPPAKHRTATSKRRRRKSEGNIRQIS